MSTGMTHLKKLLLSHCVDAVKAASEGTASVKLPALDSAEKKIKEIRKTKEKEMVAKNKDLLSENEELKKHLEETEVALQEQELALKQREAELQQASQPVAGPVPPAAQTPYPGMPQPGVDPNQAQDQAAQQQPLMANTATQIMNPAAAQAAPVA